MDFFNGKPLVYLDNAATTKPSEEVIDYIADFMNTYYYNPSASYEYGEYVRNEIEKIRGRVANFIGCKPNEIFFTSGGTESDNWALKGTLKQGDHLITSKIEHKAILNTCKTLEKNGIDVTYLNVDPDYGEIDIDELEAAIRPNTKLISIMMVNNEVGSIQDINKIGMIAKKHNIKFHTDAVQAFGKLCIDVNKYNIDMLSASSHKINGLKGTGFLYVKNGDISSFIDGGEQESHLRGGTENVIGILGLGKAVEILGQNREIVNRWNHVNYLYNHFINMMLHDDSNFISYGRNSDCKGFIIKNKTPYIINMCFPNLRGEMIVRLLDSNGICASTGSACNTHSDEPSHVLTAMGFTEDEANSSVRISLSHTNTIEEMEYLAKILKNIVYQLQH